ncbi:MAG TPA: type I restriction enzyme HsdR N-terminal domain-containing protein [Ferruginibacter sp.]|nr:type I restriction enzyme HsdR N-terminal domain-containing protein [Ferruginibacter sp.]HMP20739.1 type I restriction enzyme HsdR N-terminal domain-containing protein [Ferruginibacter sp.]
MIKIEYPLYEPKIKVDAGREFIFDSTRKKWVVLSPEEWVRQNFLQYLIRVKNYPAALIAVEKEIETAGVKKRFDIVVYSNTHQPFMIVECKEMNVALTDLVLTQALQYNSVIQAPYLVITNGSHCYGFFCGDNSLKEITSLPAW